MMRSLIAVLLAMMTALAPSALAQDEKPESNETPSDGGQAWVDDCPPDMMCAASGGNDTSEEPIPYGSEDCIECSGPAPAPEGSGGSDTCMDGQQEGETCDKDVQYIGGPTRGPADGSCENCRGNVDDAPAMETPSTTSTGAGTQNAEKADGPSNNVPAPALALALVAFGAVAVALIPRRK